MLISKSTEFLGQFVENDYVILAIPVEVDNIKIDPPKLTQNKPSSKYETELADMDLQLKQLQQERTELLKIQETYEKVIRDAER